MIVRGLFILLLLATPQLAMPSASVTVSPNTLSIGDAFLYDISIIMNKKDKLVKVPAKVDFSSNTALELSRPERGLAAYEVTKSIKDERRHIELSYPMRVFDVGLQRIPTQQLSIQLDKGSMAVIDIPAIEIQVASVTDRLGETVMLSSVFYKEPLDTSSKIMIVGLVILICGLMFMGWAFFRRKTKRVIGQSLSDVRSPLEQANDALTALVNEKLFLSESMKDHYVRLTEIIKRYMEQCYQKNLLELTSTETMCELNTCLTKEDLKRLNFLLNYSDVIKYAKKMPEESDHYEVIEKARAFIKRLDNSRSSQAETLQTKEVPHAL